MLWAGSPADMNTAAWVAEHPQVVRRAAVPVVQVLLTKHHLAIVMSYEGGGDLHSYARKYTMNEEVAR
jgi:hypothetical protein